jgi:hypothetical protein
VPGLNPFHRCQLWPEFEMELTLKEVRAKRSGRSVSSAGGAAAYKVTREGSHELAWPMPPIA